MSKGEFEPGMEVLQIRRERLCGCLALLLVSARLSCYPRVSDRLRDRIAAVIGSATSWSSQRNRATSPAILGKIVSRPLPLTVTIASTLPFVVRRNRMIEPLAGMQYRSPSMG